MDQKSNYHNNNYVSKFLQDAVEFYVNKIQVNKKKILKHRNLIIYEVNSRIDNENIEQTLSDDVEAAWDDDIQEDNEYRIPCNVYIKAVNVKIQEQQEQMQMHKKYLDHFTEIQKLRCCECSEES